MMNGVNENSAEFRIAMLMKIRMRNLLGTAAEWLEHKITKNDVEKY